MAADVNKTTVIKQIEIGDGLPSLNGAHILLVEDNRLNLAMALEFLEEAGATVGVAENGAEAMDQLSHDAFDCVLMDIQMPVMDGYEATRRIRANPALAATPVIAMTAGDSADDIEKCLAAGMNDFISKPFMPNMLYAIVSKWLLHPSMQKTAETHTQSVATVLTGNPGAIDFEEIQKWVGNDRQKMHGFLLDFLSAAKVSVVDMESALARNDFEAISAQIHYIMGPARMTGAIGFKNLCILVQQSIKRRDSCEQVQDLINQMRSLLDCIHEEQVQ